MDLVDAMCVYPWCQSISLRHSLCAEHLCPECSYEDADPHNYLFTNAGHLQYTDGVNAIAIEQNTCPLLCHFKCKATSDGENGFKRSEKCTGRANLSGVELRQSLCDFCYEHNQCSICNYILKLPNSSACSFHTHKCTTPECTNTFAGKLKWGFCSSCPGRVQCQPCKKIYPLNSPIIGLKDLKSQHCICVLCQYDHGIRNESFDWRVYKGEPYIYIEKSSQFYLPIFNLARFIYRSRPGKIPKPTNCSSTLYKLLYDIITLPNGIFEILLSFINVAETRIPCADFFNSNYIISGHATKFVPPSVTETFIQDLGLRFRPIIQTIELN
jgi:hypothetical protein